MIGTITNPTSELDRWHEGDRKPKSKPAKGSMVHLNAVR
jgi:hypothetical protein